jgi:hypothetical protein
MRTVALIDESAYGVRTDSGATVGVITAGGTITLTIATILAGIIGGVVYIAIRRWLPWSGIARGLIFGVLMVFGPGFIAIGETDLQIFEPALPIFVMFAALQVLYGLLVALILDRLHPAPLIRPRRRLAVGAPRAPVPGSRGNMRIRCPTRAAHHRWRGHLPDGCARGRLCRATQR